MSRVFVDLSSEDLKVLEKALSERFHASMDGEQFVLSYEGDAKDISLRCRLTKPDRQRVYSLEVRAAVKSFKGRAQARDEAVDVLGYVVGQYLESEEQVIPPLDWQEFSLDGASVQIRGDLKNEMLEEAADHLLAQDALSQSDDS